MEKKNWAPIECENSVLIEGDKSWFCEGEMEILSFHTDNGIRVRYVMQVLKEITDKKKK